MAKTFKWYFGECGAHGSGHDNASILLLYTENIELCLFLSIFRWQCVVCVWQLFIFNYNFVGCRMPKKKKKKKKKKYDTIKYAKYKHIKHKLPFHQEKNLNHKKQQNTHKHNQPPTQPSTIFKHLTKKNQTSK
eukprot:12806_1